MNFSQKNYTAILVDDAADARELLRLMLKELVPFVKIIGEAENLSEAVHLIKKQAPDLVFLDIQMPRKLGIELFHEVDIQKAGCEVIFTTAYQEYAIHAFKLSAVDYLLKPIHEGELVAAVEKAIQNKNQKLHSERYKALVSNLQKDQQGTLAIPYQYGYEYIDIRNIEFVEADRAYAHIHLTDGSKKVIARPMGWLEELLLPLGIFLKVHRSYFINICHISSFQKKKEGGSLIFKSGKVAEVSRSYRKELLERL